MTEMLTAVTIGTTLFLLTVNAFILFARFLGHEWLGREVARALSPYMRPLRLGGADRRRVHHQGVPRA